MSIQTTNPRLETIDCPLCGATQYHEQHSGPDLFMRLPGTFHLVRCSECRLLYQNPRPPLDEIGQYYPNHYGSYDSAGAGLRARRGMMRWIIQRGQHKRCRLIERNAPTHTGAPHRLLDIGCASGLFLEAMQTYPGWQVEGVELNAAAARATSARLGIPVFAGPFEQAQYADGAFDAIALWDVLEHLHNPLASLREIRRILRPGGVLFVRVPNAASYVARMCGRYWSGYDLPRHMTLFTPRTLAQALAQVGFRERVCVFPSGSYLAALHSLRFAMDDGRLKPEQAAAIHRILLRPAARALAWPIFSIADRMAGGSNVEALVR
jgi:SAM-dependent methyltransferase